MWLEGQDRSRHHGRMTLRIGEVAEAAGVSAPAIRYYEQVGLLPRPRRVGGQRRYGDEDVRRVTFVRRCREFGFPIEQVRSLVELTRDGERSCLAARDVAEAHLAAVRAKLAQLSALRSVLAELIDSAKTDCGGGSAAECAVLERLSRPG